MEREANYTAVGLFVVIATAMAVAFVYWYSGARDQRTYTRYEIYFEGSVSGLNVGSTVRYLGVDIGRVKSLRIDRRNATRVQVIVDIDSTAPVSESTVAELSLLGVTGLLYVDLLGRAGSKKLADPVESEYHPVIRSVRSGFDVFFSGMPEVLGRASDVAQRVNRILSDDNIEAVNAMVRNLEASSRTLPSTMRNVDALAVELRAMSKDLSSVASTLRDVTVETAPELKATIQRVRVVADNLASTSTRIDAIMAENQGDIRAFTQAGLPELERVARESRAAATEIQDLVRSLRDNPSRLIYQPRDGGVEIPQ